MWTTNCINECVNENWQLVKKAGKPVLSIKKRKSTRKKLHRVINFQKMISFVYTVHLIVNELKILFVETTHASHFINLIHFNIGNLDKRKQAINNVNEQMNYLKQ